MAMYSLVRSQVSTRSRPLPRPSATFRLISGFFIAALTSASSLAGSRAPLCATRMPPNQIESLSRSAGDRGLHQRRISDRHGDAARRSLRHRAFHHDLDQLAGAFAVARDLLGQIGQYLLQRPLKILQARIARDGEGARK